MLKLYRETGNELSYWETWDEGTDTAIVHWGIVGEKGQSKEIKSSLFSNFRKKNQQEINLKMKEGFYEINDEGLHRLIIEYNIEGMGTEKDLDKRHKLEDTMNEFLGWRGFGHCDGGSIGSGTMEVCCFVVSFDAAKNAIETELQKTDFSDYVKIFEEK